TAPRDGRSPRRPASRTRRGSAPPWRQRPPAGRRSRPLGSREVEDPGPGLESLASLDVERLTQAALEEVELVVRVEALPLGREELLDHRVLACRELHHQRAAESGEPV